MFLGDANSRDDEEVVFFPYSVSEKAPDTTRKGDREIYVMGGEYPESIYHIPTGECHHIYKDCPALFAAREVKERYVCKRCLPPQRSVLSTEPWRLACRC